MMVSRGLAMKKICGQFWIGGSIDFEHILKAFLSFCNRNGCISGVEPGNPPLNMPMMVSNIHIYICSYWSL